MCYLITKSDIINVFKEVGLKKGDIVLVHSGVEYLGPTEAKSRKGILNLYYDAFMDVLGSEGTLCVPAYFYEYARYGIPYDIKLSPVSKELGAFSQLVVNKENSFRSYNPITAIGGVGAEAEYICTGKTMFSYGVDSPWERLHKKNAKVMFLGCGTLYNTFAHYVEYATGVPHMYTKIYNTPILNNNEKLYDTALGQVRYLKYGVNYNAPAYGKYIERSGYFEHKCADLGTGQIQCAELQCVFDFFKNKIQQDYYYCLSEPPKFIPGEIPLS